VSIPAPAVSSGSSGPGALEVAILSSVTGNP
jgi:hypothetical protein